MAAEDVFGIVGTTQAGNFHVEKVVAQGGFGVVYRALHGGFRAPVAIKCLKIPEAMSKQERDVFLEKFREEAELTFRLSAAIGEVCRPLHVDVLMLSDGRFVPFLAMEWLEGESLDTIVTKRREQGLPPLGLHKVVKMMRPVAAALAKAHRFPGPNGAIAIIHRDLKPENLIVASIGGTESMKILDFGIAKAKRAASQAAGRATGRSIAEDETASFTPAYGAPEQWAPKSWGETGPWTDVWGLALTMVEALTGKPPIDGEPWVMRRVCLDEKRRPTPRNGGADVTLEIEKVFEQALAVDPRRRFKTVEAFWSDLERAMGQAPTLGPRDDRREPGDEGSGITGPASSTKLRAPPLSSAALASSPLLAGAEPLARIELAKMPAPALLARAPKSAESSAEPVPPSPSRPASLPGGEPPQTTAGAGPSASGSANASPASFAVSSPSPSAKLVGKPPASVSGSWEFDLGAAIAAPGLTPPVMSPTARSPGPVRRPSMELEMPLPTAGGAGQAAVPPSSGVVRRHSMELELPLPSQAEPPVAYVPPSLEMSLPFESTPQSSTRSLEANLPSIEAPAPQRAPDPPPPRAPAQSGSMEELLRPPPPRTPEPSASPALVLDVQMPQRKPSDPGLELAGRALGGGEFDVSMPPRGAVATPPIYAAPPPRIAARAQPIEVRPTRGVGERLRAPLRVLLVALVVAGADIGWLRITGERLMFGPIRPFWVAAPLALFGVGFTLWRMMEDHGD